MEKNAPIPPSQILHEKNLDMVIVISKEFWKVNENTTTIEELPENVQSAFEKYNEYFNEKREGRELKMLHQYGTVDLTLTFDNGEFKFKNVSTIQATLISLFDEKLAPLTVRYLADYLKITDSKVKKHINFWVMKGVLIERVF